MGSRFLLSSAGLLGAAGIGIGAAGTHAGGGDLARLASTFLLIHAATVTALGFAPLVAEPAWLFVVPGALLAVGSAAFGGDLALLSLAGSHAVRFMAPVGGLLMIAGWIATAFFPWLARTALQDEL